MEAPVPENEEDRLEALQRLDLLDTPPEKRFDQITRLASVVFGAPIALVSLVDKDRQWFKSCFGLDETETGRDVAFCAHAILSDQLLIVEDATKDERFANNPLVTGPMHIRFYAGCPLRSPTGLPIGTLCVIDMEPRRFSHEDAMRLTALTEWVEKEIQNRAFGEQQGIADAAARHRFWRLSRDLLCVAGQDGYFKDISPSFASVLGYSEAKMLETPFLNLVHPDDVASTMSEMERLKDGETTIHFRNRYRNQRGEYLWLDWDAVPDGDQIYAVARDVTSEVKERTRLDRVLSQLQQSTNELREFTTIVSHDLRAPLRRMKQAGVSKEVEVELKRLEHMIAGIIDYEKVFLAPAPTGHISLDMLWEETLDSFRNELSDTEVRTDGPLGEVKGIPRQLTRVFHNLVDNSIKYASGAAIWLQALPERDHVVLHYRDEGPGLNEEQMKGMWQPFAHGKSGMGMPLLKRIIERHGGTIRLGNPPRGVHFIIELPSAPTQEEQP